MESPTSLLVGISTLVLSSIPASAAFTITTATVQNGALVVSGRSTTGTSVVLDNQFTAPITGGNKNFSFSVVYLPSDCIVDLTLVETPRKPRQS